MPSERSQIQKAEDLSGWPDELCWTWPSVSWPPDPLSGGWSHCLSSVEHRRRHAYHPALQSHGRWPSGTPLFCSFSRIGCPLHFFGWMRRAMLVWIVSALGSMPQIQDSSGIWVSTPLLSSLEHFSSFLVKITALIKLKNDFKKKWKLLPILKKFFFNFIFSAYLLRDNGQGFG